MTIRKPSCTLGPFTAEKNKRRKLIQQFIALSSHLPGLKKMDMTSMLEDAIKYLKELQERVHMLEEQAKDKSAESNDISCHEYLYCHSNEAFPEIEARAQGKDVLVRIHCQKQKDCLSKLLDEIEKVHLTIVNICALPFGDYFLDITVVAQMGTEFCMTMKDLKRNLQLALLKVM